MIITKIFLSAGKIINCWLFGYLCYKQIIINLLLSLHFTALSSIYAVKDYTKIFHSIFLHCQNWQSNGLSFLTNPILTRTLKDPQMLTPLTTLTLNKFTTFALPVSRVLLH